MKRLSSFLCWLAAGTFMCTGVAAHNPPPKQNNLVLLGTGETLELAFLADCNVPQDTDDADLVEPEQREISFDLVVETQAARFVHISAVMTAGQSGLYQLPSSTYGTLFTVSVENVSGRGTCQLSSTGRIVGASGETRATGIVALWQQDRWSTGGSGPIF